MANNVIVGGQIIDNSGTSYTVEVTLINNNGGLMGISDSITFTPDISSTNVGLWYVPLDAGVNIEEAAWAKVTITPPKGGKSIKVKLYNNSAHTAVRVMYLIKNALGKLSLKKVMKPDWSLWSYTFRGQCGWAGKFLPKSGQFNGAIK